MIRKLLFAAPALLLAACATAPTAPSVKPDRAEAPASEIAELSTEPGPGQRMPSGRALGVRSAVVAPNAAAATAHPLATQTALDVMKRGGSAMDAAIAANAMLGLVEPTGNGIGGDLFAIVWDPETQELYGYNGSGRSPMGATLADMQAKADEFMNGEEIPPFGAAPVTVPGTVEAWGALHEKFGRLPFNTLLEPAITYAREGAPIPEVIAYYWQFGPRRFEPAYESGMLEEYDNARATYFSPAPREGSLFRNPDLADTLEEIAYYGPRHFYDGDLAHRMGEYFERIGGFLTYEDFATHEGEWVEPICVNYRETKVCELPPNTQGVAALQMLQMLEGFDLRTMGWGSPDALMAQVEAKRLAFADRARGYADPEFSGIETSRFVTPGYNRARGCLIDLQSPGNARPGPAIEGEAAQFFATVARLAVLGESRDAYCERYLATGLLEPTDDPVDDSMLQDGDTTYLTVADENGMMVSLIQSNYRGMGSGLVPDGMGFMFQDRGQLFSLDPEHPNVFEPGKRPFHTIIPAFAFRKDMPGCQVRALPIEEACPYEPWLSFGLMGGGMQPQGHVQIILNLIDFDMGLQEAGDAARWEHIGGCEPTDDLNGDPCEADMGTVHLEAGIPEASRAELEARGHSVECCRANAGGYQAIMRDFETGAWIAATEMRKDGVADGY
ncbi:MAG: gamma-glutamyltransferase family protein [Hyphomonadaceae bacterium]|nr:gamma-glutamyltransferase family protein [Hyphomonadaceae bacterium]